MFLQTSETRSKALNCVDPTRREASPTRRQETTSTWSCPGTYGFPWLCTTTRILPAVFVLLTLERNEVFFSLSPASSRCATLACSHCGQGVALPDRLAYKFILHSASTFMVMDCKDSPRILQPRHLSTAQVNIRMDSCHPLNLGQCARGWSPAHVSKASYVDLSLVRCFVPKSEEFVSEVIFSTVSLLLRTASWSHKYWISMCFALHKPVLLIIGQCRTGVNVQPNRDDSTQVFGECLNSHRLCCCAVASVQFCFDGAGGDNALLLRPSFDQVLPVQAHAPADRLS